MGDHEFVEKLRSKVRKYYRERDERDTNFINQSIDQTLLTLASQCIKAAENGRSFTRVWIADVEPRLRHKLRLEMTSRVAEEYPGLTVQMIGDGVSQTGCGFFVSWEDEE